jgi:hypothetical protein
MLNGGAMKGGFRPQIVRTPEQELDAMSKYEYLNLGMAIRLKESGRGLKPNQKVELYLSNGMPYLVDYLGNPVINPYHPDRPLVNPPAETVARFTGPANGVIPPPPPPSAPSQESLEAAVAADNETRMSLEKSMEATRGVPDAGPPYKAEVLMDGSSYILDRNNTVIVVSKTRMEPRPHHGNFPGRSLDELYREGVARAEQAIKELTARYTTQPPPPPPPPPPIPTGREIYNLLNPPKIVGDPKNYGAPGTSSTTYYSGQSREEEMRRRAAEAAAAAAERDRLERERRKRVATFVPPRPPAFTPLPSPVRPGFVQLTGRPALLRRRGGGKNEKAILKMLNAM